MREESRARASYHLAKQARVLSRTFSLEGCAVLAETAIAKHRPQMVAARVLPIEPRWFARRLNGCAVRNAAFVAQRPPGRCGRVLRATPPSRLANPRGNGGRGLCSKHPLPGNRGAVAPGTPALSSLRAGLPRALTSSTVGRFAFRRGSSDARPAPVGSLPPRKARRDCAR